MVMCTDVVKARERDTFGMLSHCVISVKSNTKKFDVLYQLNRCASFQTLVKFKLSVIYHRVAVCRLNCIMLRIFRQPYET